MSVILQMVPLASERLGVTACQNPATLRRWPVTVLPANDPVAVPGARIATAKR